MSRYMLMLVTALALLMAQSAWAQTPLLQGGAPDGLVSVEAEHFDENIPNPPHTWDLITVAAGGFSPPGGFSGGAAMQSTPTTPAGGVGLNAPADFLARSPRLDYLIEFAHTGTHYVWVLGWGLDGNSDSLHSGLDGQHIETADRIGGINNNYRWTNSAYQDPERIMFEVDTPGLHTLNIWMREDGSVVDKIVITTNPNFTPQDFGPPESPRGAKTRAGDPIPASDNTDVPWYVNELSWTAGEFAQTHNVYFATNFNDVNDRAPSALLAEGLTDTSQPIETALETTYYWAADEVNGAPDFSVHAGDVWSFTVEAVANLITGVTASADSQFDAGTGAGNVVDGSGLADGRHGTEGANMWLSTGLPATIEFSFDEVHSLHEMHVWNQNQVIESFIGFGAKDVLLEVSTNGSDYTAIEGVGPLNQATGTPDYTANTIIPFNGVLASSVRMTITSAYGVLGQVGLSEVQFTAIPAFPREFSPADGTEVDDLNVTLNWRAGRHAAEHQILLSQDRTAVADGSAVIDTTADKRYALSGLEYGQVYFTQIIDVAADGASYPGPINQFYTPSSAAIDDMEGYKDEEFLEIWATWIDGFDDPANGSLVGNGVAGTPETDEVYEGGQSLPLHYDTAGLSIAEATRTFDPSLDLTVGVPDNLGILFQGDPNNGAASVNLTVTDAAGKSVKVSHPDPAATNLSAWTLLNIPFADLGSLNLSSIRSITFGVEGAGASGTVFADYLHVSIASPSPELVLSGLSNIGASSDDVVTWFEAESGAPTAPLEILHDPAASGGQYVAVPNGAGSSTGQPPADGLATYSLTIPEDGVYRLAFRVIAPTGSDDSFWVRIPGMVTNTANHASGWVRFNDIQGGTTWHWDEVHSSEDGSSVVEFTLSSGTHTLEVHYREDGTLLDAIALLK